MSPVAPAAPAPQAPRPTSIIAAREAYWSKDVVPWLGASSRTGMLEHARKDLAASVAGGLRWPSHRTDDARSGARELVRGLEHMERHSREIDPAGDFSFVAAHAAQAGRLNDALAGGSSARSVKPEIRQALANLETSIPAARRVEQMARQRRDAAERFWTDNTRSFPGVAEAASAVKQGFQGIAEIGAAVPMKRPDAPGVWLVDPAVARRVREGSGAPADAQYIRYMGDGSGSMGGTYYMRGPIENAGGVPTFKAESSSLHGWQDRYRW